MNSSVTDGRLCLQIWLKQRISSPNRPLTLTCAPGCQPPPVVTVNLLDLIGMVFSLNWPQGESLLIRSSTLPLNKYRARKSQVALVLLTAIVESRARCV